MKYNVSIQSEDFPFIIEAIKLRTMTLIDHLEKQAKTSQETNKTIAKASETDFDPEIARKRAEFTRSLINKRTFTSPSNIGEIIKDAIKDNVIPETKPKAPYGYKKDGAPKKRAGRPPNPPF